MSYQIRSGDCLSVLAQRFNTSVSSLMKANPQIKNANLIYTGNALNIPGSKDSFDTSSTSGARRAGGPSASGTPLPAGSGKGSSAYNVASQYLGQNISSLKYNGSLAKYLDKWPGNNVCCANFVSASLEKAGLISHSEHNDSVAGLAANLRNDPNFRQVSLANAKPGDAVMFNVPGEGSYSHTVLFAGFKNGQPQFIGSNNVNSDGSQRITQSGMSYPIAAIFQHV